MRLPPSPLALLMLLALSLAPAPAEEPWESLFDGQSLTGWKAGEHPDSFQVVDGMIFGNGPRAHLFYLGPDGHAEFENFELELEAKPMPGCNSGVYFHATWQEANWPRKSGFEVQINNTQPPFERVSYVENKKTGSLYGVRNLYKGMVRDNEWFTLNILVRKPRVEVRLNGKLVTEYTEPANMPVLNPGTTMDFLTKGTFALQCHDEKSQVYFRHIRIRRLPPGEDAAVVKPVLDAQDLQRAVLAKDNFPLVDLDVRLDGGPTSEQLRQIRINRGLFAGLVYRPTGADGQWDEAATRAVAEKWKGEPVFIGLEASVVAAERPRSRGTLETCAQFDYLLGRLREGDLAGSDAGLMDRLVDRVVYALEAGLADVWANPLYLPPGLAGRGEELWTEARMDRIIAAAVKHGVALEINPRERTPTELFLARAKAAGAKFAIGGESTTAENFADWSYVLEMQKKLGLGWKNMWVPGHEPTRAQRELMKP